MAHEPTVYVLDEPTTSLHLSDVGRLVRVLDQAMNLAPHAPGLPFGALVNHLCGVRRSKLGDAKRDAARTSQGKVDRYGCSASVTPVSNCALPTRGSLEHSRLAGNMHTALKTAFDECEVFQSDAILSERQDGEHDRADRESDEEKQRNVATMGSSTSA
jgi:hypothetical protein